ncbi:Sugar-specific transcriptional regulator TrmB [Halopenitus malekzadehii]|uniref:Sugar-specific transcriptional regulator TrmB n=1 Tax=Halopenitus malekzadehii TaxID=1267564 RepID=A0A1H6IP80_9EURY|nr:helix-turn-helix domain-containing protein [Halopenitus malekzadehii]SEH50544.1 Sugar-specific transcriptional regulator TrmB [Halopenitus malekzadehii]
MTTPDSIAEAAEALRQFELREYESKCFVGLLQLSTGTAKEISQITDVPRTRVYDAVRVLEARELVTIQHSSPKRFRAVPPEEAIRTFRERYERELERLAASLDRVADVEEIPNLPDVWTMTGETRIEDRIRRLIDEAMSEVVLVVGDGVFLSETVVEALTDVRDGVSLLIGGTDESLHHRIRSEVPRAETFVSGLEWLAGGYGGERSIGRLLLIDRSAALVSTVGAAADGEHAMFGAGSENGLVVVTRQLLARDGPLTLTT